MYQIFFKYSIGFRTLLNFAQITIYLKSFKIKQIIVENQFGDKLDHCSINSWTVSILMLLKIMFKKEVDSQKRITLPACGKVAVTEGHLGNS